MCRVRVWAHIQCVRVTAHTSRGRASRLDGFGQVLGTEMATLEWYQFAWAELYHAARHKVSLGEDALLMPDIDGLVADPLRKVRLPHLHKAPGRQKKKRFRKVGEGADFRNVRKRAIPKCRYGWSHVCCVQCVHVYLYRVNMCTCTCGIGEWVLWDVAWGRIKNLWSLHNFVCVSAKSTDGGWGDGAQPLPCGGPHGPIVHHQCVRAVGLRVRSGKAAPRQLSTSFLVRAPILGMARQDAPRHH